MAAIFYVADLTLNENIVLLRVDHIQLFQGVFFLFLFLSFDNVTNMEFYFEILSANGGMVLALNNCNFTCVIMVSFTNMSQIKPLNKWKIILRVIVNHTFFFWMLSFQNKYEKRLRTERMARTFGIICLVNYQYGLHIRKNSHLMSQQLSQFSCCCCCFFFLIREVFKYLSRKTSSNMMFFTQYLHVIACDSHLKIFPLERFSDDRRKTKTLTNHKRSNQRDEPIRIPYNYLKLAQSAGKISRTRFDWFWFCL